jgi:acetyl/propionyl-CoA carboxylase alpha subunit
LFVKSIRGRVLQRVDGIQDLRGALIAVRAEAALATGESGVWLEHAVDGLRSIGIPVVADRHGSTVALGPSDAVLQHPTAGGGYRTGVEEFGAEILGLDPGIEEASVAIARAIGWAGVGRVNWAVARSGSWFFQGFSGRLPTAFDLVEAVHGIDLLDAQLAALAGEPLGWDPEESRPSKHGIQLRLLHIDPATGEQPAGTLTRLRVPGDPPHVELGVDEGMALDRETDPLLAKMTVAADTRAEAIAAARELLAAVEVAGVPTNLDLLRRQLDDPTWTRAGPSA